jgi:hypothetical protein
MNRRSTIFLLLMAAFLPIVSMQGKEISHYIFPEFVPGTILMKDGTKNQAFLNFNAATEEMVFKQNDQVLALADVTLNQIDTIFIEDRKFVVHEKKIMEVLRQSSGYILFVQYKCRVIPPGKPAGYGGTSQTSASDSYSGWSQGGKMYELQLPDDFKVVPYTVYKLQKGSEIKNFTSMGQFRKYYKKKNNLFQDYVQQHKPDFNNQLAMAQLVAYMETNE